jgi:DNA-binding transcriptional regulator GbsR (MarR family)
MKRHQHRLLWPTELLVSDAIGRAMHFWGFRRNMGRVWAVLFLSSEPLSAEDLRAGLELSSGAVSMTLSELFRWGVIRKIEISGDRRDFYEAEVHLWSMVSRVLGQREQGEIVAVIDALTDAVRQLENVRRSSSDDATRARADLQRERISRLLDLARLGHSLLQALVATGKVDAAPLARFLLGHQS